MNRNAALLSGKEKQALEAERPVASRWPET
jgi:hypothetical protein